MNCTNDRFLDTGIVARVRDGLEGGWRDGRRRGIPGARRVGWNRVVAGREEVRRVSLCLPNASADNRLIPSIGLGPGAFSRLPRLIPLSLRTFLPPSEIRAASPVRGFTDCGGLLVVKFHRTCFPDVPFCTNRAILFALMRCFLDRFVAGVVFSVNEGLK